MPNIARDFQANEDGSVYTLRLREGMRWSDGKPLTTNDVVFDVNDVWLNTDINPIPPQLLRTNDHPAEVEQVDRSTFKIIFPEPGGLFLQRAATRDGVMLTMPSHYLKQFHKKYNPTAAKDAKAAGFESWMDLFSARADPWHNPDLPTLNAWKATTALGSGTRFVTERNPYYWRRCSFSKRKAVTSTWSLVQTLGSRARRTSQCWRDPGRRVITGS